MWSARPLAKELLVPEKQTGDACSGQQVPPSVSPITYSANVVTVTVAVVRSQATTVQGKLGGKAVDVILDSGSSVSLVKSGTVTGMKDVVSVRCARSLRLVTASDVMHDFVIVDSLQ